MNIFVEIFKNINWTQIIITFLGLFLTGAILKLSFNKVKQKQKSGQKSVNYQSGGDINIRVSKNDE